MNNEPQQHNTWLIRVMLAVCIFTSIGLMYYVNIINKDYKVFTRTGGPVETSE